MSLFKKCTCCAFPWLSRAEFLQDEKTVLIGYQANFCQLELGYFLFNHLACESTIAIPAGRFKDMYAGPLFTQRLTGTEVCQGFCEDMDAIEPCDAQCECAYVREIMQIIRNWPKEACQLANIAHG
ncbi:hypothetical protein D1BOALGB6SA_2306 [Olavius sp. associated proteobacterium Delta 1]|nr:hypothetical protein D1BOALGB6SA_2306 [Olavius sp. associated proteobacterium Delta 1]